MKYLKKTAIVFIPILISLFLVKSYIETNHFKGILQNILTSSGLDAEFDKVQLEKFYKLKIDNLKVKDMEGNLVIDSKETEAKINLLMPSRLLKIDVNDATVNLERNNDKYNIFNVIKPSDNKGKPLDRTSRIGRLYINNATLNYSDISYKEKIEKTLYGVNGFLETSKSRGFILEAKGKDKSQSETLGIKLGTVVNGLQNLKSIFDNKKNDDESRKNFYVNFEFDNVKVNEKLGQFVPLDIIKIKDGILNGNLSLNNKNVKKTLSVEGKLNVKNGTLSYIDYAGDIKNIDANIDLNPKEMTVNGNSKLKNGDIKLNLGYNLEKGNLKLGLNLNKVPFEEVAKYKIIKDSKVNAEGLVSGKLDLVVDTKKEETTLESNFNSPNIKLGGYNFRNLETTMKLSKEQILTLNNTKFHFDETINNFKVKNDVNVEKFTYNIKNKNGTGNYTLNNKGSDYSVQKITGNFTIDKNNIINSNFYSNEIDGNLKIDPNKMNVLVNANGKSNVHINYDGSKYTVNPLVENLLLDLKNKNILKSGLIKTKLQLDGNELLKNPIDATVKIVNGDYNVDALVNLGGQYLKVGGVTTKDMVHNYNLSTIKSSTFDVAKLLKASNYDLKGLAKAKLPITLSANIKGKGNEINGNYEIYSPYGEFIVEYEELYAKGKIRDLLSLNLDVNAKMEELWLGYQRLKNVETTLDLKNNILKIVDAHNDKMTAKGTYNLKTGDMNINSNLNDYILYNTIKPEVNVIVGNLTANVKGTIDKLNGEIILSPSKTTINSRYIGDTKGQLLIENGVLNFEELTLRDNNIAGKYDLKTGIADITLNLNETDIPKLFEIKDLTFGTASKLNLKGDLNKFNLNGNIKLENMSYKGYKLPVIDTNLEYSNGDIDKLFKYGTFDIKNMSFIGDDGNELFQTATKVDLQDINLDLKLENKEFVLDSVKDLREKGYKGTVNLDFLLKGKPEDFTTNLKIKSDELTLSGFPVKNLDVDLGANNKGLNLGQFYLEYEENPLLVNGYIQYLPVNYNFSILAKDFNLAFLGVDKNIEEAGGIANIDIVLSNKETVGSVLLDNFNYKTKDGTTRAENINADIAISNSKLNINKFDGGYNGGTFKVDGNLDIPTIPEDFMKTKRLELGKFELTANVDNIGVKYGKDVDMALTGDIVFTENRLFGTINVNSGEVRGVPTFGGETETLTEEEQKKKLEEKTIVEGIVEEVIDKVLKQYSVDINLQTNKKFKLNIPSVSLIKNLKGDIVGAGRVLYESGETSLIGNYSVNRGSFLLNGHNFSLENVEIRFNDQDSSLSNLNPFVLIEATTTVNDERIEIGMNGYLQESNITLKSSSGLEREQILSLLAFNTKGKNNENDETLGKTKTTDEENTALVSSLVDTTLNELIFSPVTGKIREVFGLTNFSVNTGFEKNSVSGEYIGATTLHMQDNLYKDRLFWNVELKFPFQSGGKNTTGTTKEASDPLGYNIWLNYDIAKGIGIKAGGETIRVKDENMTNYNKTISNKNKINYYLGVNFSSRADSIGELMKNIFKRKKLKTLTK